jgi:glycosyltransferase involved in cell wall biosynthesis
VDKKSGKKEFNAVGWHSEKTLSHIAKKRPVLICAEVTSQKKETRPYQNMIIKRIWEKSAPLSFIPLLIYILRLYKVRSILVQFEFNVFGGIIPNLSLLLMLTILRLAGKQITFEMHQVILDISQLEKHINIKNKLLQKFFDVSLVIFYRMVGIIVNKIVVFEQELKNRLVPMVDAHKIEVLSLAVDKKNTIPIAEAKKLIGIHPDEFVVLVFGFINGYKGIDWIIEAMKPYKNIKLLIAGGENPYLKDKPFYQKFYQSILDMAQDQEHIIMTGFIPDEKVSLYFSAADLVVMPYTVFMSASGPFSLTLAHNKPILLSQTLLDYSKTEDFMEASAKAGLINSDLFFSLETSDELIQHIEKAKNNKEYLKKLEQFSSELAKLRSSSTVIKRFDDILFLPHLNPNTATKSALARI